MPKHGKKVSASVMRRKGRISWFNQLVKAGKLEEATAWAKLHRLHIPPFKDPTLCVVLPGTSPEGAVPATPALSDPCITTDTTAPLPARASGAASTSPVSSCISHGTTGGAGVRLVEAGQDLDQSAPRGQNLQSIQSGLGGQNPQSESVGGELVGGPLAAVGSAPSGACPASPSGEVEGKGVLCQAGSRKAHGWDEEAEGVVGVGCRNKWYVEVSMPNGWAKADVGDWMVQRGDRVRARLKWVSADGRDAEYEILEKVVRVEEPRQAAPVGLAGQGNVGVSHFEAAQAEARARAVFQTLPPQSLGLQQLPVPVIHDQPKEVVFQTTTMEQIVARERVGVLHASGKTGPAPVRENFRSPVLDDVPAVRPDDGPSATDMIERMRQEAYEAALRGS